MLTQAGRSGLGKEEPSRGGAVPSLNPISLPRPPRRVFLCRASGLLHHETSAFLKTQHLAICFNKLIPLERKIIALQIELKKKKTLRVRAEMVFYVPFLVSMAHEATSFCDKRTLRLGQQGTEQEPSDQILHLPTEAPR